MIEVFRPNYAAQDATLPDIGPRIQVWRLIQGAVIIAVAYIIISQFYFGTVLSLLTPDQASEVATSLTEGATPGTMYVLLFQFSAVWVSVAIACVFVHKRSFASVFGALPTAVSQFILVLVALVILGLVVAVLPPWAGDVGYVQAKPVSQWLVLLPLSLLALLVQTGAEEVLFRGYLQQQLAARFRSPLLWMVIPSALFALGHYTPAMTGDNAVTITLWAFAFGLLMADLTARAGTLGPAMAVHFVNNLSALVFVSLPDQMSGLSLYHTPFGMADAEMLAAWLPVDFAFMVVMWLAARLAIRR